MYARDGMQNMRRRSFCMYGERTQGSMRNIHRRCFCMYGKSTQGSMRNMRRRFCQVRGEYLYRDFISMSLISRKIVFWQIGN